MTTLNYFDHISGLQSFSIAGLTINLRRHYGIYVIKFNLPTLTLVIISGMSFLIPAEAIPARMTLLTTIFLMLVNIGNTVDMSFSGYTDRLNGLDIWVRVSMTFVAVAIGEYAFVLYQRYHNLRNLRSKDSISETCKKFDKRFAVIFYLAVLLVFIIYFTYFLT